MLAVGRDEVDQRLGVLEVLAEVAPARVGRELAVVGLLEDLPAHVVQRRDACVAGPGQVEHGQVQREPEEVVAERLRDELVDLVASLVGGAHEHAARGLLRRERPCRSAVVELGRVQERGEQGQRVVGSIRVRASDRVVEHRVPEAVHRVRELGLDRGVHVRGVDVEGPDGRHHLARELLEHEVLVFHLGHEAGRLEEAVAVGERLRRVTLGRPGVDRLVGGEQALVAGSVQRAQDVVDEPVVLRVEDLVHRAERDVLVAATVTADEVRVQHLVVVGAGRLAREVGRRGGVGVRNRCDRRRGRVVVGVLRRRVRVVGDVGQERGVEVDDVWRHARALAAVVGGVRLDETGLGDELRKATRRTWDELPVGVRRQHRHVRHVGVDQLDPEQVVGLLLDRCPS